MWSDFENEINMMASLRYLKEHLIRSERIANALLRYPGFKKENVYLDSDINDIDRIKEMRDAFSNINIDMTKILVKFEMFHEESDKTDTLFFLDEDDELEYLSLMDGE